jgi:hypothetical protein
MKRIFPYFLAALALSPFMTSAAWSQTLQPHRALYRVELADPGASSAISDANGLIGFEWRASCQSYVTSQRFFTRFVTADGNASESDVIFSAEEARDGSSFTFDLADHVNGQQIDHVVGTAGEGELHFTEPNYQRVDLPEGTIFPTEQSARLVSSAVAGQRFLESRVFDGGDETEIYDTVARIDPTDSLYLPRPESEGANRLSPLESWFVSLSYYDLDDEQGTPTYEVSYRMFSNGIIDELHMDYGDYAFDARLVQLEFLDQPSC